MKAVIGTKAVVEALQADVDKLMGYPRKGVCVGAGPHLPIPETYSPGAFGWTEHHSGVQKHHERDEYALWIDDKVAAALANEDQRRALPAAKAAALDAAVASAAKPPPDWTPKNPAAVGEIPHA